MSPSSGHLVSLHDTIRSLRPFLDSAENKLPDPKFKLSLTIALAGISLLKIKYPSACPVCCKSLNFSTGNLDTSIFTA